MVNNDFGRSMSDNILYCRKYIQEDKMPGLRILKSKKSEIKIIRMVISL